MIEAMMPLMKKSAAGARIVNVSSRLARVSGKRNVSKESNFILSLVVEIVYTFKHIKYAYLIVAENRK